MNCKRLPIKKDFNIPKKGNIFAEYGLKAGKHIVLFDTGKKAKWYEIELYMNIFLEWEYIIIKEIEYAKGKRKI